MACGTFLSFLLRSAQNQDSFSERVRIHINNNISVTAEQFCSDLMAASSFSSLAFYILLAVFIIVPIFACDYCPEKVAVSGSVYYNGQTYAYTANVVVKSFNYKRGDCTNRAWWGFCHNTCAACCEECHTNEVQDMVITPVGRDEEEVTTLQQSPRLSLQQPAPTMPST